jgi:hypothetical protein
MPRTRPLPPHASAARYQRGCRCCACMSARRNDAARYTAARRERGKALPELIPHGTSTGYTHWGCRCDECRRAIAVKAGRTTRRANEQLHADPTMISHGTVQGYKYWGCRCAKCKTAGAGANRATRNRAKERARLDPDRVRHGTRSGYQYWGCRCRECRGAAWLYQDARSRYSAAKVVLPPALAQIAANADEELARLIREQWADDHTVTVKVLAALPDPAVW